MKCWCLLFMTKERGNDLFGRFPPASECSPEDVVLGAVLQRSRCSPEVIIFLDIPPPVENLPNRNWHDVTTQPLTKIPSPSQNEAGFFSSPILHLLITVIYCLSKGRGGRFG